MLAAPIIKDIGIETISTGYILIDGGASTTVEFISGTRPLPSNNPDLLISHALAAQFLGMQMLYIESGSGAKTRIQNETINMVSDQVDIDLIVGGGIKTPEDANQVANSGASFVVIGSAFENSLDSISDFAQAIHN